MSKTEPAEEVIAVAMDILRILDGMEDSQGVAALHIVMSETLESLTQKLEEVKAELRLRLLPRPTASLPPAHGGRRIHQKGW